MYVTKANGSRQLFDKEKVVRTCLRFGATREIAYKIAEKVEQQIYNGIFTDQVFKITLKLLRDYKPTIRHILDLRKGLSLMSSKPEFEKFVQLLLSYNGFRVSGNRLLMGKCVEHEVDGIAQKDGISYFIEAKHHYNYHSPTGLDESRIARAVLEDVAEGYTLGKNNLRIDRAMIVTNTRFSEHAKIYGKCRSILQIGWSSPSGMSLQEMIEEKRAYPLSCIRGLKNNTRIKLANSGVVLVKQLLEIDVSKLSKMSCVSRSTLRNTIEKARHSPF